MPDTRKRKTVSAQLVVDNELDNSIIEYSRKQARYGQWLNTFRNAMELYMSLQDGRVDVLKAQYPDLWRVLKDEARNEVKPKRRVTVNKDNESDEGYIRGLLALMDKD